MQVQLFHTCLINDFAPEVGLAVVRVLERLGCQVEVPLAQTCCGQPAFNAGFQNVARVAARYTIDVLERTEGAIVIPSGSCADMLIHQFEALFTDDDAWRPRARAVAARCHEFSAFVSRHPGFASLAPRLEATVAYHPSCHLLRGLGIDDEPRAILATIQDVQVARMDQAEDCCGFGGLFSVKHGDISSRMLDRKIADVTATGAARLVSCDMGCLLNLGGRLRRIGSPVVAQHLAEILDESLT